MRIERSSQVEEKHRFDDIRMTDNCHRFLPVLLSQFLQRVGYTRLDLEHQFSFGRVCDTAQHVEAGPVSVAFDICDAFSLPQPEIDFIECI